MCFLILYLVLQLPFTIQALSAPINKVCKANRPSQCYTLYKSTAGALTWTQAQQQCITYSETLATVPDLDTQHTVEKLIQTGSNTVAWLAGQVRTDGRWQMLSGEIYNKTPGESPDDDDNCAYLLVLDTVTEFRSGYCTYYKSALCQYEDTGSGCEAGDIRIGKTCLQRDVDGVTWFSAVTACHKAGYDLAKYDPELLTLKKDSLINRNIWLQVNRHPWAWNRVRGFPTLPMEFFNWDKDTGDSIPGYCLYISGTNGKWRSQLCDSPTGVSHFVCEKDSTKVTFKKPDYVIIIPVVVGLTVITVAVALLVVVLRKRNSRWNDPTVSLAPSGSVPGRHSRRQNPDQNMNKAKGTKGNAPRQTGSNIQNNDVKRGIQATDDSTGGDHRVASQHNARVRHQKGNNKKRSRSSDNRSKERNRQGDNGVESRRNDSTGGQQQQQQKAGNAGI